MKLTPLLLLKRTNERFKGQDTKSAALRSMQGRSGGAVHRDHRRRDVEGRAVGEGDPIQRPRPHPAPGQPRVLPGRLRGGPTT